MSSLSDQIKAPIAGEMEAFETKFRASMQTRVMLLDKIMNYIVKRKGKQMRPMFVFLSAGVCGNISESTFRGASLIELLHTASLVHDDVVDDASHRRGFFSINALWKNNIAVLVGDFLLSRGLLLSVEHQEYELLRIVSEAVREMSEGELLQMEKARNLDLDEAIYFEVIRKKTASLISACCAVGAASVKADAETVNRMGRLGSRIGMAFQIKDDLFDYGADGIGKPVGIDIRERKATLPLLHALSKASWLEKRRITGLVRDAEDKPANVKKVIDFVREAGGIDYANTGMERLQSEAQADLNALPESPYRTSLAQLIDYTISRKR
ncbi:MAG: polyprenyl synthetase family protein [Bacteroidota bacterium]